MRAGRTSEWGGGSGEMMKEEVGERIRWGWVL
jgi:hypothetical protein